MNIVIPADNYRIWERLTLSVENDQLAGEEPILFHLEANANA